MVAFFVGEGDVIGRSVGGSWCGCGGGLGFGLVVLGAWGKGGLGAVGGNEAFVGVEAMWATPLVPLNSGNDACERGEVLEAAVGRDVEWKRELEPSVVERCVEERETVIRRTGKRNKQRDACDVELQGSAGRWWILRARSKTRLPVLVT